MQHASSREENLASAVAPKPAVIIKSRSLCLIPRSLLYPSSGSPSDTMNEGLLGDLFIDY